MQLHTGTSVSDKTLRQFIEDCVERLRINIFRTRVSEQLRFQFPSPIKVTWKDLEGIVEVQDTLKNDFESWILTFLQEIIRRCGCKNSCWEALQHGLDLKAIRASIKKVNAVSDTQHEDSEGKKRVETPSPSKKIKKEVNNAERAKKTYHSIPPPGNGGTEGKCLRYFGGGFHCKQPEACRAGYKLVELEPGYHEGKLSSDKWWEAENAAIKMYNLKICFRNSNWGILVQDWQKLPKAEKDKYRLTQPTSEKKASVEKAASLKVEYQGMVATLQTGGRDGSAVKSHVLSEDEGSDEDCLIGCPSS
ncbi:hypothetical protein CYMTET_29883 [Cymbomonas tetramitiformis]|uniref:Uncharacterized protein n=1 Tax=Cymbomonas tetramitiformis TaxID=36881 RepID=A0AAE0KUH6_9CHLO|nr:hypothetical protein CYMTET_29883 [Cymbomonas tetramitiformis]